MRAGEAAGDLEEAVAAQAVGDGDRVDGVAAAVEGEDLGVDVAVAGFVEVVGGETGLCGGGEGVSGQQGGAEHGGFGVEVVWRYPPAIGWPLAAPGVIQGGDLCHVGDLPVAVGVGLAIRQCWTRASWRIWGSARMRSPTGPLDRMDRSRPARASRWAAGSASRAATAASASASVGSAAAGTVWTAGSCSGGSVACSGGG